MKSFACLSTLAITALLTFLPTAKGQNIATVTALHSFTGPDGGYPSTALVQGSDGNFYGTTSGDGAYNSGTIFSITPAGVLTTLYNFNFYSQGVDPSALVQGSDGNFYGTTKKGGSGEGSTGTVFSITPSGVLTILHSFSAYGTDGKYPLAALVQGSDGNFYGTTSGNYSGPYGGAGTIFSITPSGVLTTLYSFTGGADGVGPSALVQGSDGNFYGTTGSIGGVGTVFRITPAGVFTTLYSFARNGTDGAGPSALVQGSDGNFYGTTSAGGSALGQDGTVFSITPSGVLTTLYNFGSHIADGSNPVSALIQGADGNFYGMTHYGGGTPNSGTVFSITPAGAMTQLYDFNTEPNNAFEGAYPNAGLVQGSDGSFYGTTSNEAYVSLYGTVFRLTIPASTVNVAVSGGGVVTEGGAPGLVTITRTGDTSLPLTVAYKVKGPAVAGVDYKKLPGTIIIPAGSAKAKIKVKPINGSPNSGSLKIKIQLVAPTDGSYVVGTGTAKIKLIGK